MIHDGYGHQASQRVTVFVSDNLFHTEQGNQFTSSNNGSTFRDCEHWGPSYLLLETTPWSAKVHPGHCNNGGKHRRSPCFHVHPCTALCISLVLGMSEDIEDQPPWLMLQQGSSP